MTDRLAVTKTYKLFIGGAFPRSESGRTVGVTDARDRLVAHVPVASRKDVRNAVEAARRALPGWSGRDASNRGLILYRMAEMLEGDREAFVDAVTVAGPVSRAAATREVEATIDRLVCFAGWADKYAQVLGAPNAVDGPWHTLTIPEPTGVVAVVPPPVPPLLGLVSLLAPPLCAGCVVIAVTTPAAAVPALVFGEICATSDVPPGVINIVSGTHGELLDTLAAHRDIDAISAAGAPARIARALRLGCAENVKRVHAERRRADDWNDAGRCESPWTIEPFVEMKTIWHPASAR